MIALDTSALITVLQREALWKECAVALQASTATAISAGTLAELRVVTLSRKIPEDFDHIIEILRPEIVSVTEATVQRVGLAYARWGKGIHPAGLNYGDCFAYVLAKDLDCPLLFVGDDFSKTDVKSALRSKKKR